MHLTFVEVQGHTVLRIAHAHGGASAVQPPTRLTPFSCPCSKRRQQRSYLLHAIRSIAPAFGTDQASAFLEHILIGQRLDERAWIGWVPLKRTAKCLKRSGFAARGALNHGGQERGQSSLAGQSLSWNRGVMGRCGHGFRIVRLAPLRGRITSTAACRNREKNCRFTERSRWDFHILCGKRVCNPGEFLPAQATWVRADFWWQVPTMNGWLTGVVGLVPVASAREPLPSATEPAKLEFT